MNYPIISEYVEAIRNAADNFEQLVHLQPVLDADGNPVMTSGNFAVVFKMTDGTKDYAIKCFTREQEGRAEAYRLIADELEFVSSSFLCPMKYYDNELFVDSKNCTETEFPVLLMDWVEGVTLDNYVRDNLHDSYAMSNLAYQFCRLAQWLLTQPFAHGDLKPDNILVREDGSLVLVDYDGMFVPAMKGQDARELGSPNYRHPLRTAEQFDEHIDDFALASIALSLKAFALSPTLYDDYGAADRLLFSDEDYRNLSGSPLMLSIRTFTNDADFSRLFDLFLLVHSQQKLNKDSSSMFSINKPDMPTKSVEKKIESQNVWVDEYGVKYSKNGKRLIKAKRDLKEYEIREGTLVICEDAFSDCSALQNITIPSSVNSIREGAFARCKNLQSIKIPPSVTSIGEGAFAACKALKNIKIPSSVKSIGDWAFAGCKALQSIKLPSSVKRIGERMFFDCQALQGITMPSSVKSIGYSAFSECKALENINIPSSVTKIESNAFDGCLALKSINIPSSVKKIGGEVFGGCSSLKSIKIPSSVTQIEEGAFTNCDIKITLESDHFSIDDYCLFDSKKERLISCYRNSMTDYAIPSSVTIIGDSAFSHCKALRSINIPSSVTFIGDFVFMGCEALQNINIPSSVTSLGAWAFHGCYSLQSIDIPDSVTSIGFWMFNGCYSLLNINIPPSVTRIDNSAFWGCKTLKRVHIPSSVTEIGEAAFSGCEIELTLDSNHFSTDDYFLFDHKKQRIISRYRTPKTDYIIPNSVKSIGDEAFYECDTLQSINIPSLVKSIGRNAFSGCKSLKNINLPSSLKVIGNSAFSDCVSLQDINIPSSVKSIDSCAFKNCKAIHSINIPPSVKSIGHCAFENCLSLQSINIPSSVTQFGGTLFNNCKALERIIIPNGTRAKFEKLLPEYEEILVEEGDFLPMQ